MYTQFDVVALVTILIFITLSVIKGGIRSILGLAKWYGAFLLALIFYPYTKELVENIMQPSPIINGIAVFLVYIIALVVLSLFIGVILAALGNTVGGILDRILGAAVGAAMGYILVSTVHLAVNMVHGDEEPEWLTKGETYEFTKYGAAKMADLAKGRLDSISEDFGIEMPDFANKDAIPDIVKSGTLKTGAGDIDVNAIIQKAQQLKEMGYSPQEVKSIIAAQQQGYKKALIDGPKSTQEK